jgi:hypothetical protein
MIKFVPFIICLLGLLIYCLADPAKAPKAPQLGLESFKFGLLVTLLQCAFSAFPPL